MSAKISPDFSVDEKDMPATDNAIAELFEGIDAIYFMENGFKAISNELEKLSEVNMEIDELERERFKLKRQMQVVTKKITSSIVKNSLEFNKNVESYETIRNDGEEILKMIRNLRKSMKESRRKCRASSSVLTREFKRELAAKLKDELEIIRTLQRSEYKMRKLIQESNIFAFVEFSVEILFATKQYMKYSSVKELYAKLLRLIELEEPKIDLLLKNQVIDFIPEQYAYLSSVYNLIGHEEKMSGKLLENFKASFRDLTHIALVELLKNFNDTEVANLREKKFEELCKLVDQKNFLRALREIGIKVAVLLANFHSILHFHIQEDKANCIAKDGIEGGGFGGDELLDIPLMVERGVIQKSLLDNLHHIFESAAVYYNLLLSNFNLIHLKFDQFLKIIELSEKFRKFGLRHFANSGAEIYQTLQNQSNAFFKQYHSERIDELKLFLENETFTLCPVSIQFTIFDLSEFYFLKSSEAFESDGGQIMEEICFEIDSANYRRLNFILIDSKSRATDIFPALEQLEESPSHSLKFQNSISCDTPEEDEGQLDALFPTKCMPNLCNTALNLLRIIGRYIKMSKILQCTSEQAIDAILQLYNYFIYTLYQIFCLDFPLQRQQSTFGTTFSSLRLRQLMDSINKIYFCEQNNEAEKEALEDTTTKNALLLLPNVRLNLEDATNLFLLPERIIGIESGIFLSKQMELLRPVLEALIPPKKRNLKLDAFYKTLSTTPDLLEAAIGCVAAKTLPYSSLLKQIQSIDWNISEIPSQHSAYVDSILKEFEEFKQNFTKLYAYINVGEQLHHTIWSMLSLCTMRILVQGYSEAKKCTTEGRALQLLDIEQLCNSLEEMAQIRPLPHRFYVENYIKAFFLPQDELSQWIVHHTEYTLSQTSALLNAATPGASAKKTATMSRIMMNLLDASGIGDSSNPLFQ